MRVLEMIFSAAGVMSVSYEVEKILTNYFDMITIYFQVKPLQEGKEKFVSVIQKFPGGFYKDYSNFLSRTTDFAAIPSSLPANPSFSVVVAFTETSSISQSIQLARLVRMVSR